MKTKSATEPAAVLLASRGDRDTELVFRIKEGDEDALGELIGSYQRRILSVAYKMTGNWHTAQDISQEVFIRLMEKIDTFDPECNFFSWIYRIAINRSIDYLRRKNREKGVLNEQAAAPPTRDTSEEMLLKTEMRQKVRRILARVPEKYRTVLILRDIEGLPTEKIADILDVVPATARWRIFQARRLFREVWDKEGD